MLRAFNNVVHHQSVREMNGLVRAQTVGCIEPVRRATVDGVGIPSVIEPNHVLFVNITGTTDFNPTRHEILQLPLFVCYAIQRIRESVRKMREIFIYKDHYLLDFSAKRRSMASCDCFEPS